MSQNNHLNLSVVIPTYGRDKVLIQTISDLLKLNVRADEMIVVDQTEYHDAETSRQLENWNLQGDIRHIVLKQPSITKAMNEGLRLAKSSIVLFLDDDLVPGDKLIEQHLEAHLKEDCKAVVGQVLQPGQQPEAIPCTSKRFGFYADLEFPFNSTIADYVSNVMAGNLSVLREYALNIGGFNENFQGAAYRFETEFARRIVNSGGRIYYSPGASIKHLRAERGGTREHGNHLTSPSGLHSMGDYYFALNQPWSIEQLGYLLKRPVREICTRFHLKHPWYIPLKLLGELRGFLWACKLVINKPKDCQS